MKKIRSWLKMIRLFFCLAYEMTANYFRLTEDLTHNYEICRRICRKIVKSAHIFSGHRRKREYTGRGKIF